MGLVYLGSFYLIYHEIQITIKQNSYTKANESGEEAQKETMRLIDIGLPQSKNKVNINGKAWFRYVIFVYATDVSLPQFCIS